MSETANTDPLLDPAYATTQAAMLFREQLEAAADLIDYGKLLIKRLIHVSVKEVDDVVIVCGLLRQVVLSLDAWHALASVGAVQAGRPHIRGAFESSLYLEWILTKGKQRWARQLYVASLRRLMVAGRRLIPGTPEQVEFTEAWRDKWGTPYAPSAEAIKGALEQDSHLTALLASPTYSSIDADFQAALKRHEPHWYAVGAYSVQSLSAMATELKRKAEYIGIYGPLSVATHGSDPVLHFRVEKDRGLTVDPIRNPVNLGVDFRLLVGMVLTVYRRLLEEYRPDEVAGFNQHYVEKWRSAFLNPPQVTERSELFWI